MNIKTIDLLISNIDTAHNSIQSEAIRSVSTGLTLRNWIIGFYIVEYQQNGQDRATYGDNLIDNLAKKLIHIKGISTTNLRFFRAFYLNYPQIQQSLPIEFKKTLLPIRQSLTGEFKTDNSI